MGRALSRTARVGVVAAGVLLGTGCLGGVAHAGSGDPLHTGVGPVDDTVSNVEQAVNEPFVAATVDGTCHQALGPNVYCWP